MGDRPKENLLRNRLDDSDATAPRIPMYKRVAGTTEGYEILKHIVGSAFPVLDVMQVDATVSGSAPSTPTSVALMHGTTEVGRQ